jgi:hypothetical protein
MPDFEKSVEMANGKTARIIVMINSQHKKDCRNMRQSFLCFFGQSEELLLSVQPLF